MAKIDITNLKSKKKKAVIKPLRTPRMLESELVKFNRFMAKTISDRFKNQVLDKLNKSTIDKFTDAQEGNYARVYESLVKEFKKSIEKQFSDERIKKYIASLYKKTSKINDKTFYKSVENQIGVDVKSIIKTDGLNTFVNAKSLETANQLIKFKNESIFNYTQNVVRLMSAGRSLDTLYEEVTNTKKKNLNKSELVARNELKTFNQQLSDKRALNLGVEKAIWRSVGDERSRKCHLARDGKEYDIKKGLYSSCDNKTIKAGEEINCRCYAEYVVEFD